jgi:hypothetical protein
MTDLGFIVKMVIYKCRELGNPVTETLAAYVAQTTLNKSKLRTTHSQSYFFGFNKFYDDSQFVITSRFRNWTFLLRKLNHRGRGKEVS